MKLSAKRPFARVALSSILVVAMFCVWAPVVFAQEPSAENGRPSANQVQWITSASIPQETDAERAGSGALPASEGAPGKPLTPEELEEAELLLLHANPPEPSLPTEENLERK